MCGCEYLPAQTGQHESEPAASEHAQNFRSQHDNAIHVLGKLSAVEHDERTSAAGGYALRRAQTEAHQSFVVVAESQARVRVDQLFDPFEIGRRRELDHVLQRERRV